VFFLKNGNVCQIIFLYFFEMCYTFEIYPLLREGHASNVYPTLVTFRKRKILWTHDFLPTSLKRFYPQF
jgi:hypothetical protein